MTEFKQKYGPWALVAGGSEGLGAAFAASLAKRELNLVLLARRSDKLQALAGELSGKYEVQIRVKSVDLQDFSAVRRFVTDFEDNIGLMVYNAAYSPVAYFEDLEEDDLEKILNVNVKTPLLLSKLISKQMIKNQRGGIVLMSSLAGNQGSPKIATYAATKAFNTILAEGLWMELDKHNIDVITCKAGAISTPGYKKAQSTNDAPGTLPPELVAEMALKALGKSPVSVPGFTNKLANFFMNRIFPRKWAITIMDKNTKDLS